ncbi:hypothetical protein F4810DRAFT_676320 [Camillea tinctor]|nr:hypothetical protein F4810DRAFT_676320 [Camillea tinctor]
MNKSNAEDMNGAQQPLDGPETVNTDEQATKSTTKHDHGQSENERSWPLPNDRPLLDRKRPKIAPLDSMLGMMPEIQPTLPGMLPPAILSKYGEGDKPTPFAEAERMPPSRTSSFLPQHRIPTRSSSCRRAEKKVERGEKPKPPKARQIAKTLAEPKETTESLSRQELLDRYESLKETYIYDMEKRQRRLERNVEYLIRSLGPLLENINRCLEEQQAIQRESYPPGHLSSASRSRAVTQRYRDQPRPVHAPSSNSRPAPGLANLCDTDLPQSFHGRELGRARQHARWEDESSSAYSCVTHPGQRDSDGEEGEGRGEEFVNVDDVFAGF